MTSLELARRVLAGLVAGGLRDLVVAPGSRNAPLIYAAFEAEQRGDLRIHVRLDERSAGFTALGLAAGALLPDAATAPSAPGNVGFAAGFAEGSAAASGTVAEPVEAAAADAPRPAAPVAVVTTSGTAVGNLHPAVMEAAAARLPLVVVSADRPPELHGVGANQTFDQRRMFGAAPVWEATVRPDLSPARAQALGTAAAEAALGVRSDQAGPVHLNVQLRDPLTPPSPWPPAAEPSAGRQQPARPRSGPRSLPAVTLTTEPRTVVVAGFGATDAARRLAEQAGWPLLAEPASGAWAGPNAVTAAALAVRVLGSAVERVVVYGRPVLFRPVLGLVAGGQAEVVVVHPTGGPWFDQGRRARVIAGRIDLDGPPADSRWVAAWLELGAAAWEVVSSQAELSGPQIAGAVAAAAGGGPLVVGASTPIRDLALTPAPAAIQPVAAMRG
ncbi:MAG: hypothetical protein LBH68_04160, partial [Bifidobacteriaceae bacterium]|nr:hypothetical protein [Bifidobacteriaceae bacterium]